MSSLIKALIKAARKGGYSAMGVTWTRQLKCFDTIPSPIRQGHCGYMHMKAVGELWKQPVTTCVDEFHHEQIRLQADRKARSTVRLLFVHEQPTTRATPPTLDDLFVELYMDKLNTREELSESIVPNLN